MDDALTACAGIPFSFIASLLIAYFLGSIPFGLILSGLFGRGDIRKAGSGNIGATNVLRTSGKGLALLTLILDMSKVFHLIIFLSMADLCFSYSSFHLLLIGLVGTIGHCFPIWLKFKGGKGVATTLGVLFAAVPLAGLVAAATWGIVAGFFRYSSLSALCAVAITPLATFLIFGPMPAAITILIALLVFWRHKDNIKRLMAGTEPKIGSKKDKNEPSPETE